MSDLQQQMFSEFEDKKLFKQAQEYALDYIDSHRDRQVFPTEEALEGLKAFDEPLPVNKGNGADILRLLQEKGGPATIPQIGGRYFGLVNGGVIPTTLAVRNLTDYWDQNAPLYVTSPVNSMLEEVTQKWLVELLGLPNQTVAGFVSGTSISLLAGIAAARYRIFKNNHWDVNEQGLNGAPPINILASKHAHGTVIKAIAILGLGTNNIQWLDADDQGRVIAESVPEMDASTILILQAGNVNSGSFDPFDILCDKANKAGAWVHIDGAFGLWAAGTKQLCHLTKGIEKAHSWSMDGHKTLNTPYDSGVILCKDEEALVTALQTSGAYIVNSVNRDGMFYTPEMSRRARAIELWAALKYLGREGVDELVVGLHERAKQFAAEIANVEGFTVLNEVVFNQVIVKCADDELTQQTISEIQNLRECWVGGSKWEGDAVIRISVCSWATTEDDISRTVASFKQALFAVKSKR